MNIKSWLLRIKQYLSTITARTFFMLLLIVMFMLLLAFGFILPKKANPIVVFSKGLAITALAKELNDKGVSAVTQHMLVKRIGAILPQALEHYAKVHEVVILNDKEVLAGAPDITEKILATVAAQMRQENQEHKNQADKSHGHKSHG